MKRTLLVLLVALATILPAIPAHAASTLIAQERFRGTADLTSGNTGAFSGVYGTIRTWRVGPQLSTDTPQDDGRHGDVVKSAAAGGYFNVTGATRTGFCFECWYWTGELNSLQYCSVLRSGTNTSGSSPWFAETWGLYRTPTGDYLFRAPAKGDSTVSESLIPRHTWIRLYVYALNISGTNWTHHYGYQLVGGAEHDVWSGTNENLGISHLDAIGVGNDATASAPWFSYAVGTVTLTQVTTTGDFGAAANVVPPTNTGHVWHVSASGAGDGASAGAGAITPAQLATAFASSGILGNTLGLALGDHVIFDDAVYQAPTIIASIRQRGLWLDGNGTMLKFLKTVSGTWTQPDSGTAPNVWSINDSELTPLTSSVPVVFESSNGQTSVAGASFAAVKSTLNSTAGSHWSDGTTLYVHPYGNTNPNSDGKTYQRSTATSQECGIQFGGQDQKVSNFTIYGTAYYDKTNLQNAAGLAISDDGAGRVGGLVTGINATLWGKHGANYTSPSSSSMTTSYSTFELGWPFGAGAQTCIVSYANAGSQTATWSHVTARLNRNAWAVGSNSSGRGQTQSSDLVFTSHDDGHLGNEFSLITFDHCLLGGGVIGLTSGVDTAATFNSCDSFNFGSFSGTVTVTGTTSSASGSGLGLGL